MFFDRKGLQVKLARKLHEQVSDRPDLWEAIDEEDGSPWMVDAEELLALVESHQGTIQRHAETAVRSVIKRIANDPRVAYLIGPLSQTYEDVTTACAHIAGLNPEEFKKSFTAQIKTEPWPGSQDDPQAAGGDGF